MERAMNNWLDDSTLHSEMLVATAINEFDALGRGAFVTSFKNKAHLMCASKNPMLYLPISMVRSFEYAPALRMCAEYDPFNGCVLICTVDEGNGNCQIVSRCIRRDAYLIIDPKFGEDGSELTNTLTFLDHPIRSRRDYETVLSCCACLVPAKSQKQLKTCAGCMAVKYCSTVCQKRDWYRHKVICTYLRRNI
jgi:hypothetical protein